MIVQAGLKFFNIFFPLLPEPPWSGWLQRLVRFSILLRYRVLESRRATELPLFLFATADFSQFDGLIIVGGDGYVQEAVSALLNRKDAEVVRQRPLGIIPAGTANTFANANVATEDHDRIQYVRWPRMFCLLDDGLDPCFYFFFLRAAWLTCLLEALLKASRRMSM